MENKTILFLIHMALIIIPSLLLASCNSGAVSADNLALRQASNDASSDSASIDPCQPLKTLVWEPPTTYPDMTSMLSASDITGYHIYYSTVSSSYTTTNSLVVGNVTSYPVSGIPLTKGQNTTYYFVITASTNPGENGYSNEICVVVP